MSQNRENLGGGVNSSADSTSQNTGTETSRDGIMQRVRETADRTMSSVTDSMSNMSEKMTGMGGKLNEGMDRVRHMERQDYEEMWTSVKARARQNPGQTILISAAVGFVVGMMMRMGGGRRY